MELPVMKLMEKMQLSSSGKGASPGDLSSISAPLVTSHQTGIEHSKYYTCVTFTCDKPTSKYKKAKLKMNGVVFHIKKAPQRIN